ncbi:MAG: hypothetical protein JWQ35_661 [Bacteriovoracaceae bacterium]|nr:hypothetical protein [Bacteriovoracaceae bacterium]
MLLSLRTPSRQVAYLSHIHLRRSELNLAEAPRPSSIHLRIGINIKIKKTLGHEYKKLTSFLIASKRTYSMMNRIKGLISVAIFFASAHAWGTEPISEAHVALTSQCEIILSSLELINENFLSSQSPEQRDLAKLHRELLARHIPDISGLTITATVRSFQTTYSLDDAEKAESDATIARFKTNFPTTFEALDPDTKATTLKISAPKHTLLKAANVPGISSLQIHGIEFRLKDFPIDLRQKFSKGDLNKLHHTIPERRLEAILSIQSNSEAEFKEQIATLQQQMKFVFETGHEPTNIISEEYRGPNDLSRIQLTSFRLPLISAALLPAVKFISISNWLHTHEIRWIAGAPGLPGFER